ncbi:MAG: hypothetical protein BJ554DRAFT_8048, partial [Olpidium bornovanus]
GVSENIAAGKARARPVVKTARNVSRVRCWLANSADVAVSRGEAASGFWRFAAKQPQRPTGYLARGAALRTAIARAEAAGDGRAPGTLEKELASAQTSLGAGVTPARST